ncbi:MAG: hypothetical protein KKB91_09495 [Proteobacteria bacterium]|nr:hypothetical protein [Pseudomonadota bacterium]MCG2743281.1 hypothetical protein [Desulfobacteraceae bacterium]MBU4027773.1 hypothetical protein [Pseudomonadota bacterium]MBU4042758.1 hypothetical protein [Pseudomonadota bacterium]MBU4083278.1 hypothetical protein [Pseudomonadota bacterium]
MIKLRTCITPDQRFLYGIHKPSYTVCNLRGGKKIERLGLIDGESVQDNRDNFPDGTLSIPKADWIFEIPNPFPFRGTTFIDQEWADASAVDYRRISLPPKEQISLTKTLKEGDGQATLFSQLPSALLLALATCSTDAQDLIRLADLCCHLEKDSTGAPLGLNYRRTKHGRIRPIIHNHALFEAVANNPCLPDNYKLVMVVRPGAQGGSEIVGEWPGNGDTHVFEYLRRNSYIAGGHYAANMADDAIRYAIKELSMADMQGLRHLYYQRTYIRLAELLGLELPPEQQGLTPDQLERLRQKIQQAMNEQDISSIATLWGWNFGFDFAASGYRLHASHQQIHQQYAMIPETVAAYSGDDLENSCGELPAFGCGDMVAEVMQYYQEQYDADFFDDYIGCIKNNRRMDGRKDRESSLVVWQDKYAMLFVPKAQTSQWELQLMALNDEDGKAVGNILEAGPIMRASLDKGILLAQKALAALGARMVTSIEYPKRIGRKGEAGQHLLYAFLPRLPKSPGAFSEAQLRFINRHYPEDFAAVCRQQLANLE